MKKLLMLFSLILFLPVFNAEELTYFDYPQENVSELPVASSSTIDKVYILNGNTYWITKTESTGSNGERLLLNTNYANTTLYSNFTDDDCAYLYDNFSSPTNFLSSATGTSSTSFTTYFYRAYSSNFRLDMQRTGHELLVCNNDKTLNFAYFNNGAQWRTDTFTTNFIIGQWIGDLGTWVANHLSITPFVSTNTYTWEQIEASQVYPVLPTKVYVPSDNLYCYHLVDNNTLRGYISSPVVNSSIKYYDFDLLHHYRQSIGTEIINDVPVCLANTTTNYLYREDIVEILIYAFLVGFIVIFIPFKILMSFFKRRF